MDRFGFQIRRPLPSDELCAHDTCLSSLLEQLREWALADLRNDTVIRADVHYAMRTGDDAYLRALMDGRPQWRAEEEGHSGYLAHQHHCDAAQRTRIRLTGDALARAAALQRQFGDNKSVAQQQLHWQAALAERSATNIEAALGTGSTLAPTRRRL